MPESKLENSSLEPLAAGPQHGDKASEAGNKKAWEEEKVQKLKITSSRARTPVSQLSAAFSSRCTTLVMLCVAIRAIISTSPFIVVEAARLPTRPSELDGRTASEP